MGVLREISRLPEEIRKLSVGVAAAALSLNTLVILEEAKDPSDERLEELERSRARWEAEMEALLLKADSTLKSAANAESRARTMMKHAERLDPFPEEGEAVETPIPEGYAPGSKEEEVLPLRVDMATYNKARTLRAKWAI